MAQKKSDFSKTKDGGWFLPQYVASSVVNIPIDYFHTQNIKLMIIDIDDTLVPHFGTKLSRDQIRYFQTVTSEGVALCIGSNTRRDISKLAQAIGALVARHVWWSYKPLKQFYREILVQTNHSAETAVMVGDRIFCDIVGAKHAGLKTILISPINRRHGFFERRYWRRLEQKY